MKKWKQSLCGKCSLNAELGWEYSGITARWGGEPRGWGAQGQPWTLTHTCSNCTVPVSVPSLSPASDMGFANSIPICSWSLKNVYQQLLLRRLEAFQLKEASASFYKIAVLSVPCGRSGLGGHLILPVKSAAARYNSEKDLWKKIKCFMSQNSRLSSFVSNKQFLLHQLEWIKWCINPTVIPSAADIQVLQKTGKKCSNKH